MADQSSGPLVFPPTVWAAGRCVRGYSHQPLVRAVPVPAITHGTTVGLRYPHING
jgi:hypothetical protein